MHQDSSGSAPAWDDALAASLKSLLASDRTAGSVLPLVARWDSEGKLAAAVKPAVTKAEAQLADKSVSDDVRGQVAANLIGVRKLDAGIVPAVASLLGNGEAQVTPRSCGMRAKWLRVVGRRASRTRSASPDGVGWLETEWSEGRMT